MNIAVDIRSLCESRPTGVGTYTKNLLLALLDNNRVQNASFFHSGSKSKMPDYLVSTTATINDIHLTLPNKLLTTLWILGRGPQLDNQLKDADQVWFPNIAHSDRRLRKPYSVTVHDLSFHLYPDFYSVKRRLWHLSTRYIEMLCRAQKIVAVSESTKNALRKAFPILETKPIAVIPHGIDHISRLQNRQWNSDESLTLPENFALYVGTLEPRKNVTAIIRAYERLRKKHKSLELVIAGNYGWKVKGLVQQAMKSKGVHWLQYVPENQLHVLYSRAAVFIWPTFYEGFGFPPLEALMYNTPVVVSYSSALPEMLTHYPAYANPHNDRELATVIDQVLSEKLAISASARTHILNNYSWRASANKLIDFLAD